MIDSAEEFVKLRCSDIPTEYKRSAWDEAPTEIWHEVIEKYPDMREWVAHNKSIPNEIIIHLSTDESWKVRSTVARKAKTPIEVLKVLAKDADDSVRMSVACNRKVNREILLELLNDEWGRIREMAKEKLGEIEEKDK